MTVDFKLVQYVSWPMSHHSHVAGQGNSAYNWYKAVFASTV